MDFCIPNAAAAKRCSDADQLACGQFLWIDHDPAHVVWATYTGDIYEWPKSGGQARLLAAAQESINGLSIDHGYAYWSAAVYVMAATTGVIARAHLDGGAPQQLATGLNNPQYVIADDAFAYWISAGAYDLHRVSLLGGAPQVIASSSPGANSLIKDATSLYWVSFQNGSVMSAPLGGGTATPLFNGQFAPHDIAVADGRLCWGESSIPGGVHCGSINGGQVQVIASNQSNPSSVVLHGGRVYWVTLGGPVELRSAPLDGGGSTLELQLSSGGRLAVDDTAIYLTTPTGVWRLPK